MVHAERITIAPVKPHANLNIRRQYRIQEARWISAPGAATDADHFLKFELAFKLATAATFVIHVSGDQRFELFCDNQYVGMGPDRSDLAHWSFHSYEISLEAGDHSLTASVHSIATHRPHAQVTCCPALILATEDAPVELDTGTAPWTVRNIAGISCCTPVLFDMCYHAVGPNYTVDGAACFKRAETETPVFASSAQFQKEKTGILLNGWRLFPSRLPEQIRQPITETGRVRMAETGKLTELVESSKDATAPWNDLIAAGSPLQLPAGTTQTVLWDLENYHCAYPKLRVSGGRGATIAIHWAEACFVDQQHSSKGNRHDIAGKCFLGYGDTFIAGGSEDELFTAPWWRAGRYLQLIIEVSDEPLTICSLGLEETRLPFEHEGAFTCSDPAIEKIIPLAVRGIQMCAHETYMDCPYYEQMMYVGDTRLQILTSAVMRRDSRLNQRALELFDWSRHIAGFVLERHPSDPRQLSTTFSMIWIMMLRDQGWWQRDADFVVERLAGMRSLLELFRSLTDERMLLSGLPGWSFVDWVVHDGWDTGYPPGAAFGCSGVCNLLMLLALQSAIDIETSFGEQHFANSYRDWSDRLAISIRETFWNDGRQLFADDPAHQYFSEHAQCLALLSGQFDERIAEPCFEALLTADDLARTTVYFSFYLLETFYTYGRGELILEKLEFWKALVSQGFKTPVEMPEPSRSDCHAWGAHPLFHMHASLSGIRPASPGFTSVCIAPQPGGLTQLSSVLPHPDGEIRFSMKQHDTVWDVEVTLPDGLTGVLEWQQQSIALQGSQQFELPVPQG